MIGHPTLAKLVPAAGGNHRVDVEPVVAELLRHFFQPVLRTCPACGSEECRYWIAVVDLVGRGVPAELELELARMLP